MSADEKPPSLLSETNSAPDIASAAAVSNGSRKIELPKLLIDSCNYENLKKLSFQKLNELTKSSTQLVDDQQQPASELNKSKSLNNLTSVDQNGLQSSDDGQLDSIENLRKGECWCSFCSCVY